MTDRAIRPFRPWSRPWSVLAATAVLVLPVLAFPYPPMGDLPLHEGVVALLAHLRDEGFTAGLYRLNLGHPNQVFYFLALPLALVTSSAVACKVVVAASLALVIFGGAWVAHRRHRDPTAALLLAPAAMGWVFYWGLVGNLLGLGAFLASLPTLDAFGRHPTARRAGAVTLLLFLLYGCHEMALFAGMVAVMVLGATGSCLPHTARASGGRGRHLAWVLVPLLASTALALGQLVYQIKLIPPLQQRFTTDFDTPLHKLTYATGFLVGGVDDEFRLAIVGLAVVAMGCALVLTYRDGHAPPSTASAPVTVDPWAYRARYLILTLVLTGLYFAAPQTWKGATLVYHRFLAFAYATAVVGVLAPPVSSPAGAPGPRRRDVPRLAFLLLTWATPLAVVISALPQFVLSSGARNDLDVLFRLVSPGSSVMTLTLGRPTFSRAFSIPSMSIRAQAVRGGRVQPSLTDTPISPLYLRENLQWNEVAQRVAFQWQAFRPAHDLRRFRYVLAYTDEGNTAFLLTDVLREDANLVAIRGPWMLFESRYPLVPTASPDVPLPSAQVKTLGSLIRHAYWGVIADAKDARAPGAGALGSSTGVAVLGDGGALVGARPGAAAPDGGDDDDDDDGGFPGDAGVTPPRP